MSTNEKLRKRMDQDTLARLRKERDERLARVMKHAETAPMRFLAAWIRGVRIVGEEYFYHYNPLSNPNLGEAPNLESVTDKWQVSPNYEFIKNSIGVLSSGEAVLLATMCSFFNSEWGGDLMREVGVNGLADVAAKLDMDGNEVVAELLINYGGW